MTREEFEHAFNSRTLAYHPEYCSDERPVVIVFSPAADSEPGHTLLVSLINQLARVHKNIVIVGDLDRPLCCADHFGFQALSHATADLAKAINPFIDIDIVSKIPSCEKLITIGVGESGCELNLGADGWLAIIGSGTRINPSRTSIPGALLSSCLGASSAFHRVLGDRQMPEGSFSLWDYARLTNKQGPKFAQLIEVGRVLQVGAGAVGAGFDYFVKFFGLSGQLTICDGDDVDISNLNRQIFFLARDAGRNKAEVLAERLGPPAMASLVWYGDDDTIVTDKFDLVLPLANEYAVRPALQQRPQTVLLHGTTSPNWEAQVHRHVAGHDDCICCRLPEIPGVAFSCGEATIGQRQRQDASLPFLASTAALLLLAEVIRLQMGALLNSKNNYRAVIMRSPVPVTQELYHSCSEGCRSWMPSHRRIERTAGSRFANLDGDLVSYRK